MTMDSIKLDGITYGIFAIGEDEHLACQKCMRTDLHADGSVRGWSVEFEVVDGCLVMGDNSRDNMAVEADSLPVLKDMKLDFTGSLTIVDADCADLVDAKALREVSFVAGQLVNAIELTDRLPIIRECMAGADASIWDALDKVTLWHYRSSYLDDAGSYDDCCLCATLEAAQA